MSRRPRVRLPTSAWAVFLERVRRE